MGGMLCVPCQQMSLVRREAGAARAVWGVAAMMVHGHDEDAHGLEFPCFQICPLLPIQTHPAVIRPLSGLGSGVTMETRCTQVAMMPGTKRSCSRGSEVFRDSRARVAASMGNHQHLPARTTLGVCVCVCSLGSLPLADLVVRVHPAAWTSGANLAHFPSPSGSLMSL